MIALIDHYDSFSDMLADYFRRLKQDVTLIKTDQLHLLEKIQHKVTHIVIGPGPGHPSDKALHGVKKTLTRYENSKAILGVCLGHQLIAQHYGAKIISSKEIMHGRVSSIKFHTDTLFNDLNQDLQITRYHSFLVDPKSITLPLCPLAYTQQGELMAIRHHKKPIWGVQFHPEAALTECGLKLLENFLFTPQFQND